MSIIHQGKAYLPFPTSYSGISFLLTTAFAGLARLLRLPYLQLRAVMCLQGPDASLSPRKGFVEPIVDILPSQWLTPQFDEEIVFFAGEGKSRCCVSLRETPPRRWRALRVPTELYLESRDAAQGYSLEDCVKRPLVELCNGVLTSRFFLATAV